MAHIDELALTEAKHVTLTAGDTLTLLMDTDPSTGIYHELLTHTGMIWVRQLTKPEVDAGGAGVPLVTAMDDGSSVILGGSFRFFLGDKCGVTLFAQEDTTISFDPIGQTL